MTDNFALLKQPRRPWLDADELKAAFHALSAETHPDRFHNASEPEKIAANGRYAGFNAAYQCLREPRDRLRHLLELELGRKPSDLTQVPGDLMDLFFKISKGFRETDTLRDEKTKAVSPLLQVQLFERGQEQLEKLGALRETITKRRDAAIEDLKAVDATWASVTDKPLERLLEIWRLLSFYERWLAQIQERVLQLSF